MNDISILYNITSQNINITTILFDIFILL